MSFDASVSGADASAGSPTRPWQDVLDFWFHPASHPDYLKNRIEWFKNDPAFDRAIRERYGALVERALAGGLREWEAEPQGALARILLLDQFTRNTGRGTAQAFAGDAQALELARQLVEQGRDAVLPPIQRQFVYLPYMHAEDLAVQEQCVVLYQALAARDPALGNALDYAIQHRDIVARFGRFPHRNQPLGRTTTPEEAEFLLQPGSSF